MQSFKKEKYTGFTLIEMLITMAILMVIFLAMGNIVVNMLTASNSVSTRMLVREEGEYMAEVLRKYLRNSSADNVELYVRDEPEIVFADYEAVEINYDGNSEARELGVDESATEIHFRPSADATNKVICLGFFRTEQGRGYLIRASNDFSGSWNDYDPETCFPEEPSSDPDFRKNFGILNSDLIYIEGFSIQEDRTSSNVYYSIDIDMRPFWGLGGAANYYSSVDNSPLYRKSLVVQTRLLRHW
jgi:prepilin-type N-terminal cleavage/methylation domain-containing protein